jgi:CheY-like chemotaxis protein
MNPDSPLFKTIWLVDDDADDHFLFSEAVSEALPSSRVKHLYGCKDLFTALATEKPDLIFMDLNMPYVDGRECLKTLKENSEHANLPVVMLSGSNYHRDVSDSYAFGSTLYLVKPDTLQGLKRLLEAIAGLDWTKPNRITVKHYVKGKFVPFTVN